MTLVTLQLLGWSASSFWSGMVVELVFDAGSSGLLFSFFRDCVVWVATQSPFVVWLSWDAVNNYVVNGLGRFAQRSLSSTPFCIGNLGV